MYTTVAAFLKAKDIKTHTARDNAISPIWDQ